MAAKAALSKEHKPKKIFQEVSATVVFSTVFVLVVATIMVCYFAVQFVLEEKGQARVEVLEQISDVSASNRHSMENVMEQVYQALYPYLTEGEVDGALVQKTLDAFQTTMDSVGIKATIDVVLGVHEVYMTENETRESIQNLLNSYWYIKHYSGETAESWNLRFIDTKDISSYFLSLGRTVYNAAGESVAVIVINTSQETQFRALQKLMGESDRVYILDQKGIAICHTNSNIVGTWQASMSAFEEKYGFNASKMVQKNGQSYMISNYNDPESGWTYVEEQNISDLLESVISILVACIITIMLTGGIVVILSYTRIQKALRGLSEFTASIEQMDPEDLEVLPVDSEYQEVHVLGTAFNRMVTKVQKLIADIQVREAEKIRSEYDFLQAQLSPHFMHNTLIAIKSLLSMRKLQEASNMMSEFVELIYIPTTSEIPLVPLREELHLVENFISIMNCRTDKAVSFENDISERAKDILVPRMILQPLAGNAIFHGFAEKDEDCRIFIHAEVDGRVLNITVEDNGEGIAPTRLQEISTDQYASARHHHGVGLQNVKKRLGIVYGGSSNVVVQSVYGKFTRVILRIDGYEHPLMSPAAQRVVKNDVAKEEKYENFGS
ncbi:MAG: histidine kinase [Oscillibacter sp.]|nr:histidine kinase [Oscillibacter sp.]